MSYAFIDFEYNSNQVILCVIQNGEENISFDLREGKETPELRTYMEEHKDDIFVSYALNAEIYSLLRCGIDVSNVKCLDLMAECRMISMSCSKYFTMDGSLLPQVQKFLKLDVNESSAEKDRMRDLIITKNSWTNEEWDEITLYCYKDVQWLRPLFKKVISVHEEMGHPFNVDDVLARGRYIRISTEMDFATEGFPVWGDAVEKIYANKDTLKKNIIFELPTHWRLCFNKKKDGQWGQSVKNLAELIEARGWTDWEKTPSGQPNRQADYLKELRLKIPEVAPYYQAVKALSTLNSADLREQVEDGYIKSQTFAFSARTGRNGLKPTRGYLLNLPKWMRRIIHPHPNMLLVGFDWSQQEIAVAAALSGDKKLIEAYESGDVYLALAKMSGAVPPDATKKSHALERELFKALQLGLGYGKGVKSLGNDFYAIMQKNGMSLSEARSKAVQIFNWHKSYFSTYWSWIRNEIVKARRSGYISTLDNWVEFIDSKTKDTQLLNFPSQSTGAVMMRKAAELLYAAWKEGKIPPVMCSQHDAFYFNMLEADKDKYLPIIQGIMKQSSIDTIGIEVRCGFKVYDHTKGYEPEGMQEEHETLWRLAMELENE